MYEFKISKEDKKIMTKMVKEPIDVTMHIKPGGINNIKLEHANPFNAIMSCIILKKQIKNTFDFPDDEIFDFIEKTFMPIMFDCKQEVVDDIMNKIKGDN